jgi:hypothetical protein
MSLSIVVIGYHLLLWSAYIRCDVQKMNAVQVWNIGQTVEWASIRCSNKDITMACIRQVGTKAAKDRLGNTIGWNTCLADISDKAGLIERRTSRAG